MFMNTHFKIYADSGHEEIFTAGDSIPPERAFKSTYRTSLE
jgi:hypothetical protein